MRFSILAAIVVCVALPLAAEDDLLFPRSLHLTRAVSDPVTGETSTIEEFYAGNQVVSVSGARVAVADHRTNRLLVIDKARNEYSLTEFAELASAASSERRVSSEADLRRDWATSELPSDTRASRAVTRGRAVSKSTGTRVDLSSDNEITLSRAAAEVLFGIAHPNQPSDESRIALAMSERPDSAGRGVSRFALPLETRIVYILSPGEEVEVASRVTTVAYDLPNPDLFVIPPGAKRVELTRARIGRELEEIERLPR